MGGSRSTQGLGGCPKEVALSPQSIGEALKGLQLRNDAVRFSFRICGLELIGEMKEQKKDYLLGGSWNCLGGIEWF